MADPVVYRHAIESLFLRSLEGKLTVDLKDALRAVGLDLDRNLPRGTPQPVYAAALGVTVHHLYGDLDKTEGYRQLGIAMMEGMTRTLLGKALVSIFPIFGPDRVLTRMQESFSTVNNYLTTKLHTHDVKHRELWFSECNGNPGYMQGIIEKGMQQAGAKNLCVVPHDFDGHQCTYDVCWD